MKKRILLIAVVLLSCLWHGADAQVSVHFNIGVQPVWGPTGYDYARYYYIPDIDAYYDVDSRAYVYFDDGRWITASYLPPRYRDFDLYRAHKVVINEPTPWLRHDQYRQQYVRYRGYHDQVPIRDSHEERYWQNPNHPEHYKWHGEEHGERGHGEGHGGDHERGEHRHGEGHEHGEGHGR